MSRKNKVILWVAIGFLAILAATSPLIMTGIQQRELIEQRFSDYSKALVRHDYPRAYSYCGPAFRKAVPYESFQEQQEALEKQLGKLLAVRRRSLASSFKPTEARGYVIITADHQYEEKTIKFVYEFRYDHGEWLLWGFKTSN